MSKQEECVPFRDAVEKHLELNPQSGILDLLSQGIDGVSQVLGDCGYNPHLRAEIAKQLIAELQRTKATD